MRASAITLLLLGGLFFIATAFSTRAIAMPPRLLVTGTAENLKTGKTAYREHHDITKQYHTVRYVDPNEKLIASKEISYRQGYNTPEYTLHDLRFDRRTGSLWQDGHFVVFRQEGTKKIQEIKVLPVPDLVIDAGFDHFIRSRQDVLAGGEILSFTFAVADPLLTLNMKLEEVSQVETAIRLHDEQGNNNYRYFRAHSSNFLFDWAIPDINLAYDNISHLLQIYQGPSNITDMNDKSQTVVIRYEYQFPK